MSMQGPSEREEKLGQYETAAPDNRRGVATARRSRRTSQAISIGSTHEANQVFGLTPDTPENESLPQLEAVETPDASGYLTPKLSSSSSEQSEADNSDSEESTALFSSDNGSYSEEEQEINSDDELTQPIDTIEVDVKAKHRKVAKRPFEDDTQSEESNSAPSSSSSSSSSSSFKAHNAIKAFMALSTTAQFSRMLSLAQDTIKAIMARPAATATGFGLGFVLLATGFSSPVVTLATAMTFTAIEATRYARAKIAKWHYRDAVEEGLIDEVSNQIDKEHGSELTMLLVKGSQAQTSWPAYIKDAFEAPMTFVPFSQASANYQAGREMKRRELKSAAANSPIVDSPETETPSSCCATKPR